MSSSFADPAAFGGAIWVVGMGKKWKIGVGAVAALIVISAAFGGGAKKKDSGTATGAQAPAAVAGTTASSPAAAPSSTPASARSSAAPSKAATAAPTTAAPPAPPKPAAIAAIALKGSGQSATEKFTVTDGLAVFHSTCSGCGENFAVTLLDSGGQYKDLLVNTIGKYDGAKAVGLTAGTYRLKIEADASWGVAVTQPRDQAPAGLPQHYSGHGDQVVGPFSADDAATVAATNKGEGNFALQILDSDGGFQALPVNEIGSYKGSTVSQMMSDGPYYLDVTSEGAWTVDLSAP